MTRFGETRAGQVGPPPPSGQLNGFAGLHRPRSNTSVAEATKSGGNSRTSTLAVVSDGHGK